jgi:hypothetical protein
MDGSCHTAYPYKSKLENILLSLQIALFILHDPEKPDPKMGKTDAG